MVGGPAGGRQGACTTACDQNIRFMIPVIHTHRDYPCKTAATITYNIYTEMLSVHYVEPSVTGFRPLMAITVEQNGHPAVV